MQGESKKWSCPKCQGTGKTSKKLKNKHITGANLEDQYNNYDPVDCDVCGGRGEI